MTRKITITNPEIELYAETISAIENNELQNLVSDTQSSLKYSDMLSGNQVGSLLQILIKIINAKYIVEVGMFTGSATLAMAHAACDNAVIYSLELNEKYIKIAERNLNAASVGHKIRIIRGNARETALKLDDGIDFCFLDADKDYYPSYYEILIAKMRSGGVMVIDNMLWHGNVLDPGNDRKALAIDLLNKRIKEDDRVESVLLTVRDGLHIVRKT
jgi:caffeoyl-CoA O-methyltransferase